MWLVNRNARTRQPPTEKKNKKKPIPFGHKQKQKKKEEKIQGPTYYTILCPWWPPLRSWRSSLLLLVARSDEIDVSLRECVYTHSSFFLLSFLLFILYNFFLSLPPTELLRLYRDLSVETTHARTQPLTTFNISLPSSSLSLCCTATLQRLCYPVNNERRRWCSHSHRRPLRATLSVKKKEKKKKGKSHHHHHHSAIYVYL